MDHKIDDGWHNPLTTIAVNTEMRKEDGLLRLYYSGWFWYNGICFHFYICQRLPPLPGNIRATMVTITSEELVAGQWPTADLGCRGELSIIDPQSGFTLKLTGSAKRARIKKSKQLSAKRCGLSAEEVETEVDVTVRKNIRTATSNLEVIKDAIEKAAKRAYAEHEGLLARKLGNMTAPDTITPAQTYNLYHTQFFDYQYLYKEKPSPETFASYRSALKSLCYELPVIPMKDIRRSHIEQLFQKKNTCDFHKGLLRSFWDFCRNNGYCTGEDPFSKPTGKKKRTAETLAQNSVTPESLSLEDCNRVYKRCMEQVTDSGLPCAVALSLFGGFSFDKIGTTTWGDIMFNPSDQDDVRVQDRNDTAAGATHDRTRPLLIQGARILTSRYHHLLTTHTPNQLADMPVVVQKNAKLRPTATQLTQYCNTILYQSGIAVGEYSAIKEGREAVSKRLFRNTYAHLIDYECGLQKEFGTREYLHGTSLTANTSADHYIGYSSEDGQRAMVELLHRVGPNEEIPESGVHKLHSGGGSGYICRPAATARLVVLTATVEIPPGGILELSAPHGVSGSLACTYVSPSPKHRKRRKNEESSLPSPPDSSEGQEVPSAVGSKALRKRRKKQQCRNCTEPEASIPPVPGSAELPHEELSEENTQLCLF